MSTIVKPIAMQQSLDTANTVSNAAVVRVHNNTAGVVLITRSSGGVAVGSITLLANSVEHIQKDPAETLTANAAVLATSVAFTY
jgi:ClpP class serine protease